MSSPTVQKIFSGHAFSALSVILIGTILVFAPILQNQFTNWDDGALITNNEDVQHLDADSLKNMFTKTYVGTYIPLTVLSFAIERHFYGDVPVFYFFDNLILHLLVVMLCFMIARKMGFSTFAASAATLIFAIHPLRVESVAWIAQRKDLLYSVFYLASILYYIKFQETQLRHFYWTAVIWGLLSILSKPMAYSLPFVLLLFDWWKVERIHLHQIKLKIPFFLIIGGVAWITFNSNPHTIAYPYDQVWLIWIWVFVFHIQKWIFPFNLTPVYEQPLPLSLTNGYYLAVLFMFLVIAFCTWRRRNQKIFVFAITFYFMCQIFIIIRSAWNFGSHTIVGDRFMYLASFGLSLWVGLICEQIFYSPKRLPFGMGVFFRSSVILIFGMLMTLCIKQTNVWRNNLSLWSYVIACNPKISLAYQNRAAAYLEQKQYSLAFADLNTLQGLEPQQAMPYYLKANLYYEMHNDKMALDELQRAFKADSQVDMFYFLQGNIYTRLQLNRKALDSYSQVIAINPAHVGAYFNRGMIWDDLGRVDQAYLDYAHVIRLNPRHPKVYNNLAALDIHQNNLKAALEHLNHALTINPGHIEAIINKGVVFLMQNQYNEAFKFYNRAIQLDPGASDAYLGRGLIYAMDKNWDLALGDLNRAAILNPQNENVFLNRAKIKIELKEYDQAIVDLNQVITKNPDHHDAVELRNKILNLVK